MSRDMSLPQYFFKSQRNTGKAGGDGYVSSLDCGMAPLVGGCAKTHGTVPISACRVFNIQAYVNKGCFKKIFPSPPSKKPARGVYSADPTLSSKGVTVTRLELGDRSRASKQGLHPNFPPS